MSRLKRWIRGFSPRQIALSLTAVLMTAFVGSRYIREEMERLRFGDLTAWASNVPDADFLTESIRGQEGVEVAETQRLYFF